MELSARDIAAMLQEANLKSLMDTPPLDLCYDLFCDSETYQVCREEEGEEFLFVASSLTSPSQRMQLDRVLLHDSKRQTYDQTRKCVETLLLLGQVGQIFYL